MSDKEEPTLKVLSFDKGKEEKTVRDKENEWTPQKILEKVAEYELESAVIIARKKGSNEYLMYASGLTEERVVYDLEVMKYSILNRAHEHD